MAELVVGRFHIGVRADRLDQDPRFVRNLYEESYRRWRLLGPVLDVNMDPPRVKAKPLQLPHGHLCRIKLREDLVYRTEDSSPEVVEIVVVFGGSPLDLHREIL